MNRTLLPNLAVAFSLANLLFIHQWSILLKPVNQYYRDIDSLRPYLIAIVLNVILLAGIFLLGFYGARQINRPWSHFLAKFSFLLLIIIPLNGFRVISKFSIMSLLSANPRHLIGGGIILFILFAVIIYKWHRFITHSVKLVVLLLFPYVIITFSQAIWFIAKPSFSKPEPPSAISYTDERPAINVLWIIFDMMDQRIAFAERPPDLDLPEFDRLRAESLSATNAFSPNDYTIRSIPALFTGRHIKEANVISPTELSIIYQDSDGSAVNWSQEPNIFSFADEAGYNTAIAGRTYHPYCQLFSYITSCAANTPREDSKFKDHRFKEVALIMAHQIYHLQPWWTILREEHKVKFYPDGHLAIQSFHRIHEQAKSFGQDSRLGLTFIHYNIPHHPFINDRHHQELSIQAEQPEGYFGNLVLADRTLGELRQAMEIAGTWDSTVVIVTSDHHWHKSYLYDGQVNPLGVPFLLKLPNQQSGVEYHPKFNTVLTHDLILNLLNANITTYQETSHWLDSNLDRD